MGQVFFHRLLWALLLVVLQGVVFNHIHFFGYATPLVYVYILCLLPLSASRLAYLWWGFATGMGVDFFSQTPGLAASSLTLSALCAPTLLRLFTPKDSPEDMVPGLHTLGKWNYIWFVSLLVTLHQAFVLALEMFSFFRPVDMLYTFLGSSILSVLLVLAIGELAVPGKRAS